MLNNPLPPARTTIVSHEVIPLFPYVDHGYDEGCKCWAVSFPELPGCIAQGATLSEAVHKLKEMVPWYLKCSREQVEAVGRGRQALQDQTVRIRRALGVPEGAEGDTEDFARSAAVDAARWRAVRDDLAVEIGVYARGQWRIVGNEYRPYPGPAPANIDEAADRLIALTAPPPQS